MKIAIRINGITTHDTEIVKQYNGGDNAFSLKVSGKKYKFQYDASYDRFMKNEWCNGYLITNRKNEAPITYCQIYITD